jgi:hypothetical protein
LGDLWQAGGQIIREADIAAPRDKH